MNLSANRLTIFGLGYVGLPLALIYAVKGYPVYGVDISAELVRDLRAGITGHLESYRGRPIRDVLGECLSSGSFIPTSHPDQVWAASSNFIVTVGMPVKGDRPDFAPLERVCRTISRGLKKGDTVMIRSTVVPGTTEEIVLPILENSGLKGGEDFSLIYCPERISEGKAFDELENIPVLISGIDQRSMEQGTKIIKMISRVDPVPVSRIKTAETAKVVENIQRDVNIALMQQVSEFCAKLGIDVCELMKGANTHPRVHLLQPGPGVGGYCIPNALHYLAPKASETGTDISLLTLSRQINREVPKKIAGKIKLYFRDKRQSGTPSKLAVLGIAMKDYCSDDRDSPIVHIIEDLTGSGMVVSAYDNWVGTNYPFQEKDLHLCLLKADGLLIGALQRDVNYQQFKLFKSLMRENPVIFDTKGVINKSEAEKYGFEVIDL
ncbi:nucleotide sugar dehydrogenase [Candidatus Formimonas warabiya]|uniref:UDP-glucose/GDP-mannose dehydrogenase C-terminal domain-containing protein n=1 Tax=Formimonas warabiya TaxID=1761012 RepID=A0A3G1KSH8_FORW1|nr:nucleotide sugar dehydrogenase [Candidatus Formimonas warabiya]ATW25386.1 hypothetical protein DCMF_11940 [Candidatus Formimonas warabiya]